MIDETTDEEKENFMRNLKMDELNAEVNTLMLDSCFLIYQILNQLPDIEQIDAIRRLLNYAVFGAIIEVEGFSDSSIYEVERVIDNFRKKVDVTHYDRIKFIENTINTIVEQLPEEEDGD